MGYTKKTIKGVSWIASLRGVSRIVTILRMIVVARFFLTPYQFGLFGIASIALAFLEILTETGINVFLIQEKEDTREYINAAWTVSIVRGIFLFLVILILTPLISNFYNAKDAMLLIALIAFVPLIRGFINPSIVRFQRDLEFHKEFFLKGFLLLGESTTIIFLAYITRNPASLVWGIIVSALFEVLLSFLFIKPTPKIAIEINKIQRVLNRGKWVTLAGIFSYLAQEGDNMVVGKVLGIAPLAIYQTGYKLSTLPVSEVTDVVSKVVFPVYTKIAEDKIRLRKAFLRTTLFIVFFALLLGAIIILFPRQIVLLTLGQKWIEVSSILQILAIYGILRAIFGSASALFLAVGKQEYVATMTFVRVLGLAIAIIPLTLQYGLIGAGYAALFSVLIELPIIIFFTIKTFK